MFKFASALMVGAIVSFGSAATAATIDFSTASNGPNTPYVEDGLSFDIARIVSGNCSTNGDHCLALNDNEVSVLTKVGGGTFSLASFWFELLGRGKGGREPILNTLTIMSNLGGLLNLGVLEFDHNDGGQVFDLTLLPLFQNVTSLIFTTTDGGNVRVDDLVLAGGPSQVPLPAGGALLLMALAGVGLVKRRKLV